jgi:hypothetical protein
MMHHEAARGARRRLISIAMVGSLASASLLAAWLFARRGSALAAREPAALLLEFLLAFVVTFSVLLLAWTLLVARPARMRRERRP